MLESRHESEPDALAQDGSFGWIGVGRDCTSIGNRLKPMRAGALDQWVGGCAGGSLVHRTRPSASMGKFIKANVSGDSIQPSPQCCASVELIQTSPRADDRFLRGVVSVNRRAEHAVAVPGQRPPMCLHLLNIRGHFMTNLAFSMDTADFTTTQRSLILPFTRT
jgi:hypothetical protein